MWYLHSHFVCARFCSFAIKKHLFDVDGSLNNSVFSKRCFFRYDRFVIHPLSGWFSVSVASAPSTA